jgi:hypothetical protein
MGVSYLAIGATVSVGGYTKWQILETNCRVAAEQINKVSGDGIIEFPTEWPGQVAFYPVHTV